ncbi:ABC-type nitrate/sulfonate/bicarbonate transport system permease component [Halarchaeum rubridurum]|uniref:ABC transporter permease n=1 Tax=Halarchaeum rubridurum TaxID=489911 RepID=A0A830FYQ4_9EURY|nr:ABC transporter permease [Halarchaeum rubridurum]MBP1954424.1 ABC-type nitrate/sulfonate/bicarbonate transport system permease component [Halarchaeum rubridurum]GGM60912.1 ABC transporter permease [Halarchaeum rubridurum]
MATNELWTPERIPDPFAGVAKLLFDWIPLLLLVLGWEVVSGRAVSESVLPPPTAVAAATVDLFATGEVVPHLAVSLLRVGVGLSLSIVVGVLLGIGMSQSEAVENFFDVFLSLIYPLPKTALVPLALLWLGIGTKTAVLIVFLACLLPIVMNANNAAENVDRNLIRSARMMGTSDRRLFWKVVIPATIPEILTGIRQAIPFAFISLISAELIASEQGMGRLIRDAGSLGRYPAMFATIVIISAVAYTAVYGFEQVRERVLVWT